MLVQHPGGLRDVVGVKIQVTQNHIADTRKVQRVKFMAELGFQVV